MNEKQAREYAKQNGLNVSSTKIIDLGVDYYGRQAKLYEVKVGSFVCSYDTRTGGAACWKILKNDEIVTNKLLYKSEAIFEASKLQIAN